MTMQNQPASQARFLKSLVLTSVMLGVAALGEGRAWALGARIPNQDAEAIARGNAFVATADNPSALYYNPAGITQLEGEHFQVGSLFYLGIDADYQNPATGASASNAAKVLPVPTFQYTVTPKDSRFSFGLGVYEPFGLSVNWPENNPFRTAGVNASLTYITINPVVAWKVTDTLSLAVGPTLNYSSIDLVQGIFPLGSPGNGAFPGNQFNFKGHNWGFGFNAGLLWHPVQQWSFGVSYRSATTINYHGAASFQPSAPVIPFPGSFPTSSKLEFPQIVIGGVSYRPTTNWNFEVDVDWADWNSVKQLSVAGLPSQALDWHPSCFYEFGVTRYLPKGYFVSAGYFFSEATTSGQYFAPLVADTDLHVASLGGGHRGKSWDWALAAQLIGGGWRNVSNLQNPSVDGRYRLFTPTVSFSVGYHF
jgi:long-chain fatty acid transport protein